MKLEELGYNDKLEKLRIENDLKDFEIGRVISEHKERYIVKTEKGEVEAEITGNLRFSSKSREDFPAVGDWVALTICNSSKVSPIIVLSKIDLIDKYRTSEIVKNIKARIKNVPILAISNESQDGYDKIITIIEKGKTYCMLGSSGVGKSTLLNNLSGKSLMRTDSISQSTNKGRHVTSHRELIILKDGGILVDNPGMREVGIVDSTSGLEITFDLIIKYSQNCRFKDCTHTNEIGCSVIEAVETGEIDRASYENYMKMEIEKAYFESSVVERRKKE